MSTGRTRQAYLTFGESVQALRLRGSGKVRRYEAREVLRVG
jgi:hypothetical protein